MWIFCTFYVALILPGRHLSSIIPQHSSFGYNLGDISTSSRSSTKSSPCNPWVEYKCQLNNRPIIGILSEELRSARHLSAGKANSSYIAASYVKWAESGGARVVPVLINQSQKYYVNIFSAVNGILFPGGGVSLRTSGYAKAGRILYDLASEANQNGTYFPLWGTCLGFEFLSELLANQSFKLSSCNSENISLPITLQQGSETSRMFRDAPKYILDVLRKQNVTANSHKFCVTSQDFTRAKLDRSLRLLSTSTDRDGKEFISAVEGLRFPFYGVQFHPEKNNFEWKVGSAVPHSAEASLMSQYFANVFVSEARKNLHAFTTEAETSALIYNWNPVYSQGTGFDQMYIFPL